MPLAFESIDHGQIAFGFFNIDSDMLLVERSFFFADRFCAAIEELAVASANEAFESTFSGFVIERPEDVGDLMGAIRGERFTGFIGETYRRYPFPAREEDFRQKPEGCETRGEFEEVIREFGRPAEIHLAVPQAMSEASLAGYRFLPAAFRELVKYVWRGGYPRWRGEERPAYVAEMGKAVLAQAHPLLAPLAGTMFD